MFEIQNSKRFCFGNSDLGFACPVKYALSYFWLMDCDPSGKEKSSVSGEIA
jgi:hypothetical protein